MKKHKEIALESMQSEETALKLKLNYFSRLELHEQGIQFMSRSSKNDVEAKLFNALKCIHIVRSVFCNQPLANFLDINMPSFECLPCKPLHCIANHI